MYLGDGHLNETARSVQLRITLDAGYPGIVQECAEAISAVVTDVVVHVRSRPERGACIVEAASPRWPALFPQHGPGRKHERTIALATWQQEIVTRLPGRFLRGLLHSDGCRSVNRFATRLPSGRVAHYSYPRYFFTNRSDDIRALFCEACDLLGIRWTRSSAKNISVAHRSSVEALDALVGPKA